MKHTYTKQNARALFELMEERLTAFAVLARGPVDADGIQRDSTLAKMLEDGGFPATESKAMLDALDTLDDAFQDLYMAVCMPFDMEQEIK